MKRYIGKRKELKIYISSEDIYNGKPLFEALLFLAKDKGIAGATVVKAVAGIGVHSDIHTFNVWTLKQNMPLVISIIDTYDNIKIFLEASTDMIAEGLVTISDIEVIQYNHPKFGDI